MSLMANPRGRSILQQRLNKPPKLKSALQRNRFEDSENERWDRRIRSPRSAPSNFRDIAGDGGSILGSIPAFLRNRIYGANDTAERSSRSGHNGAVILATEKSSAAALPIDQAREEIVRAVALSDVVIVVAETGAGKSSRVPQYLLEEGYDVTNVTQPRRLAASSLADWVAQQQSSDLGDLVGFRHALENCTSKNSKLVFATDGYQLVRELHTYRTSEEASQGREALILDEVHEFNPNMEALLALMRMRGQNGTAPKLIIMSATMDAEGLSAAFGGAPIIDVVGRNFPVEDRYPGESMAVDATRLAWEGLTSLCFLPGKREIEQMRQELLEAGAGEAAEILVVHSQMPRRDQELVFKKFDRPKIILATDIAQTSLTIDDVDAVLSSGLIRRLEVEDGIPALIVSHISQFDFLQQRGRAGRTHPGIHINYGLHFAELDEQPPAAIQNTPLESLTLRLLSGGVNIRNLRFLHPVQEDEVNRSFRALQQLNLVGSSEHITEEGKLVAKLPLDPRTGRMLIKAIDLSDNNPEVVSRAIDIAALIEVEGITLNGSKKRWERLVRDEHDSDHLAQLKIFETAIEEGPERYNRLGIDHAAMRRALQMRTILRKRLKLDEDFTTTGEASEEDRRKLLESIWSGMIDCIFTRSSETERGDLIYRPIGRKAGGRQLGRDSVVDGASFVVGKPFDVAVLKSADEQHITRLLVMATRIDRDWLMKHRPTQTRKDIGEAVKGDKARERRKKPAKGRFPNPRQMRNGKQFR